MRGRQEEMKNQMIHQDHKTKILVLEILIVKRNKITDYFQSKSLLTK